MARKHTRSPKGQRAVSEPYTLAKTSLAAEGYDGPDWAPVGLWDRYRFPEGEFQEKSAQKLIFSTGAEELWAAIAKSHPAYCDSIAHTLPIRCAEIQIQWRALRKRAPAEHKKVCEELSWYAKHLNDDLFLYFWEQTPKDSHMSFERLLKEHEVAHMGERIRRHNFDLVNRVLASVEAEPINYEQYTAGEQCSFDSEQTRQLLFDRSHGIVLSLPYILVRIAELFEDYGEITRLQRPNSKNAERNFFARSLIRFFHDTYKRYSPSVVARVTSVFFAEGIDDNEVKQFADYLPDGRHSPLEG